MWVGFLDMVIGYGGNNGVLDGDGYIVVVYILNFMKINLLCNFFIRNVL